MKVISLDTYEFSEVNQELGMRVGYEDGAGTMSSYSQYVSIAGCHTYEDVRQALNAVIIAHAPSTITEADIQYPTLRVPSFANPSRSLNSAFQVSTDRNAVVNYTVDIAATLSLTTGQTGTVTLKYADDSGMTTNVVTVQSAVNGNGGTLAIGLGLTQTASASLGGMIPAGKYVKLVTANTVGTPTFTFRAAQEVLI